MQWQEFVRIHLGIEAVQVKHVHLLAVARVAEADLQWEINCKLRLSLRRSREQIFLISKIT